MPSELELLVAVSSAAYVLETEFWSFARICFWLLIHLFSPHGQLLSSFFTVFIHNYALTLPFWELPPTLAAFCHKNPPYSQQTISSHPASVLSLVTGLAPLNTSIFTLLPISLTVYILRDYCFLTEFRHSSNNVLIMWIHKWAYKCYCSLVCEWRQVRKMNMCHGIM